MAPKTSTVPLEQAIEESFPFLKLPFEIRNLVYVQLVSGCQLRSRLDRLLDAVTVRPNDIRNILLANKQIHAEARPVLLAFVELHVTDKPENHCQPHLSAWCSPRSMEVLERQARHLKMLYPVLRYLSLGNLGLCAVEHSQDAKDFTVGVYDWDMRSFVNLRSLRFSISRPYCKYSTTRSRLKEAEYNIAWMNEHWTDAPRRCMHVQHRVKRVEVRYGAGKNNAAESFRLACSFSTSVLTLDSDCPQQDVAMELMTEEESKTRNWVPPVAISRKRPVGDSRHWLRPRKVGRSHE